MAIAVSSSALGHDPREERGTGINMVAVYIRNQHARLAGEQARPGLPGGDQHDA